MDMPPPRVATLVLVNEHGVVLGALPAIRPETPWWTEMAPLLRAVRRRDGLELVVLRLLEAEGTNSRGGAVTYLAQVDSSAALPALQPWPGTLTEHTLRQTWARVNGPLADVAWARGVVERRGGTLTAAPEQIRSWNLSSLWRLPTTLGVTWLKVVPPFFAHEGAVLAALSSGPVPRLLGHDGARVLLAEVPGEDLYTAPLRERLMMVDVLVNLQQQWIGRSEELIGLGAADWRAPALTRAIGTLLARRAPELPADERERLLAFNAALPERWSAIEACGLPETLVHGDFHAGNFRGGGGHGLTLLDWGDSGVGHPLLDQPAFVERSDAHDADVLRAHWVAAWQRVIPGAQVERAALLLAPIAAARQALIYQHFLDHIEDNEHPYHREDPVLWLRRAAAQP